MKPSPKSYAAVALALVGLLVLGSIQGRRLDRLNEAEAFYRWLINAATNMRIENTLEYFDSARTTEALDNEFFTRVSDAAEQALPEIPAGSDDTNAQGELYPKLIRAVHNAYDDAVWDFARSSAAAELRDTFHDYAANNRLQSLGKELTTANLYGQGEDQYNVGVSSVFFGFRKVAANFLWLEVDKYWHRGHYHRMVPLMRTCVTLDPSFVDAYLLGAWHLAYNITARLPITPEPLKEYVPKYDKRLGLREQWYYTAADFLKEGVRNNPRDYRLYFDLGYAIYDVKLQDWPNSIRYLREATHHRHDRWVPRRLNMSLMNNGNYEEAIAGWERYLEQFPDNTVAQRFLRINRAYLHEAIAEEARDCANLADEFAAKHRKEAAAARAAGDADKAKQLEGEARTADEDAQALRDRAELEIVRAQSIWTEILQTYGDPLAEARLLRIDALELLEQGRPLEAIGALREARWKVNAFWEEASAMILDIKLEHDIALTTSERVAVQREREAAEYKTDEEEGEPIRRLDCKYRQLAEVSS